MRRGFTLVEIMVVVAIIALLAAIAIPNLLRARIGAQESTAAAAVKTIVSAQTQYRIGHSRYANLGDLDDDMPPYMDSILASGRYQSFNFDTAPVNGSERIEYTITAVPETINQAHTFYSDEDGVICRSNATGTAAPAGHTGKGCPNGFAEMQ